MSKIPVLILMGPPGSGKGTQAKEINQLNPRWLHISTGDLFRKEIASASALGLKLKETLASGNLVSDDQTNQVFRSQLLTLKASLHPELFILDGYPRTAPQGDFLRSLQRDPEVGLGEMAVLELLVDENAVVDRLSGRLMNPKNGRIYHTRYNPPRQAGICDEDGGALIQRDDDKESVIRSRFAIYNGQKDAILNSLKGLKYMAVPGEGKASDITQKILQKVREGLLL